MQPHRGTLLLVLGILSIVICQPLGFFAWFMAKNDLKAMAEGRMDPAGRDLTVGGKICGIIGVVLFVLTFLFVVVMMLVGGGLAIFGAREASQQTPPETIGMPQQVIELFIAR